MNRILLNLTVFAATLVVAISAHASLFEIQCRTSETDMIPEFTIITEDHVNYTFAAVTSKTQDMVLVPRLVVTLQDEGFGGKVFGPREANRTLQTLRYEAVRLLLRGDLFSDIQLGADNRLALKSSAQLIAADGKVVATLLCGRIN